MKKAICFAGGGSKGAYQLGAWKALNELGEDFQIATGTSIGSINAAFYVQKEIEKAEELWYNLDVETVMVNGINMEMSFQSVFKQREQLIPFMKTYFQSKGADITPFHDNIKKYFKCEEFFSSDIDYALMTVKYPSMSPVEITKEKMREKGENAWEWIAASCAAFPVFPVMHIDGEEYVDGGYYDNLPIASAFKLGAESVVAVDLNHENSHKGYIYHPCVTYIRPSQDLGAFLNFDKRAIEFSSNLGYYDTMKVYGKYLGIKYIFSFADKEKFSLISNEFLRILTFMEANFDFSDEVRFQRVNKLPGCTAILSKKSGNKNSTSTQLFIAAFEEFLDLLEFDSRKVYSLEKLLNELKFDVDRLYPMLEYDTAVAFDVLFKFIKERTSHKSRELKSMLEDDRRQIILCSVIRALQHIPFM